MTTRVVISTGDHPARVLGYPFEDHQPVEDGESRILAEVAPHSTFECCAHSHEAIGVIELPEATPVAQVEAEAQAEAESEAA